MISPTLAAAIKEDAIARYPEEACGLVVNGAYRPAINRSDEPTKAFKIAYQAWTWAEKDGAVEAVAHSHVAGGDAPSGADMRGQIDTAVPWILTQTDGEVASDPWAWGDMIEPPPLIGRPFRHGPSGTDGRGDCYALIRDWYRSERGVTLKDFPRDPHWWNNGADLYTTGFAEAGFRSIPIDEVGPGDVFLCWLPAGGVRRGVPHHGGVVLANDLILHHLTGRLSKTEPLSRWTRYVTHWLRYDG